VEREDGVERVVPHSHLLLVGLAAPEPGRRRLLDQILRDIEITRQLEHVRSMKEYPTTFTMWSQILVSVILPQILNMSVQFVG